MEPVSLWYRNVFLFGIETNFPVNIIVNILSVI